MMNKKSLAEKIVEKNEITLTKAEAIVTDLFEEIATSLKEKNDVSIANFGIFKVKYREPRMGRNPKTGESIKIAGRNVVSFKSSSVLKEKVK